MDLSKKHNKLFVTDTPAAKGGGPVIFTLERYMSIHQSRSAGPGVPTKYRRRGGVGGLGLGLLVGVLVSGPHFYEWSPTLTAAVIFGGASVGAAIGWFFASAVVGFLGSGPGYGEGPENIGDGDAPGGDASV